MKPCRMLCAAAGLALAMASAAFAQRADSPAITSLRGLIDLTPAQAAFGPGVKINGTVVCYDAGWHQLYLNDGRDTQYFDADQFATQPAKGQLVQITGRARGTNTLEDARLVILGPGKIPAPVGLNLSDLGLHHGDWVQVRGQILSGETTRGRLALLLRDNGQNCLIYVLGSPPAEDFHRWINCRVAVRGINASLMAGAKLERGLLLVPGLDEMDVLGRNLPSPAQTPVTSIGNLLDRELGSWTNQWVHVNGLIVSYQPGKSLTVKDPTGVIEARVIQLTEMRGDERVDVWGFFRTGSEGTYLAGAYFEAAAPPAQEPLPPLPQSAAPPIHGPIVSLPDILKLRQSEAALHIPVRLTGVITFADADWGNGFLQQNGDAVYVDLSSSHARPRPGDQVTLTGWTSPGGFAPEVVCSNMRIVGATNLPPPAHVDLEDLANGHFDSHWVEMEGLVRRVDELSGHASLTLMTSKGRFSAIVPGFEDKALPDNLIDSLVAVRGACTSELNARRQLSGITLHVPNMGFIRTIQAAPADPFAIAATPIQSVATFDPNRLAGRRIKLRGVVTLRMRGEGFILQGETGGLRIVTRQTNDVQPGDLVDVIGFPAIGDFSPYLEEAVFRVIGAGSLPQPRATTAEDILLRGDCDSQIVQIEGHLLQSVPRSANPRFVLQEGPIVFTAELTVQTRPDDAPDLETGSLLRLTGVCVIQGGQDHEPETFRVLLRSPADVRLIESPPYWTSGRAFALAGGMMLAVAAALGWVALLRKQVRRQTAIIHQKLKDEAALEERYRELFENATDMLYTHDRMGRVTSINMAGERLLQRPRAEILGRNFFDFIAEEYQPAARQWLAALLQHTVAPTAEWDFIAASGQRVKLEISIRLIDNERGQIEVEGIARDITERKRLEREILEISNREQRRIGHDLHDGVCQQLAGISFLTATLAEDLEAAGVPQSVQAEKISAMLNDAIDQTRGVARGLFPVRLDEKGLVAALEELATNASEVYKISCRFHFKGPAIEVENQVALHLYYIVLEALANAAKHSGASTVEISLQPTADRWVLMVRDDGRGFSPGDNYEGMGLRILNYRARVIGATLSLQTKPGSGTSVSCLFLPATRPSASEPPRRHRADANMAKPVQT